MVSPFATIWRLRTWVAAPWPAARCGWGPTIVRMNPMRTAVSLRAGGADESRPGPAGPAGLPPRTARVWAQAVRPFSFTASIVPVLLGSAIASAQGMFTPGLLALALLGAVGIQGAANLFSDYFDYRGGYDTPESFGGSGVLLRGILQPSEVFLAGLALMAASVAIGLYLTAVRGTPILILGILGAFGAYFYSGRPIAYKYHALGDPAIFLLFGPLLALGAY